ncbi:MAG: oxaloacetate decarboxylase [Pseudomonadota bacterium]
MTPRKNLRAMIEKNELVQAPGVFDALSAKIVQAQGFNTVYMTGYGTCASMFALPDLGLLTMTEMVDNARRIADAVDIPLIADADTGYGNPINVVRTVREFEKAGVAAIHIEDQTWPKRCGHMSGKSVIPAAEMAEKIKAAVDARKNQDFLIIARTDALGTDGFDHAMERANLYAESGADILFIEAPVDRTQVENIPRHFTKAPLLLNLAPLTPNFSRDEISSMGYAIVIYPGVCLAGAIEGCTHELKQIKDTGKQREFREWAQSFQALNTFLGVPYYRELGERYKG